MRKIDQFGLNQLPFNNELLQQNIHYWYVALKKQQKHIYRNYVIRNCVKTAARNYSHF